MLHTRLPRARQLHLDERAMTDPTPYPPASKPNEDAVPDEPLSSTSNVVYADFRRSAGTTETDGATPSRGESSDEPTPPAPPPDWLDDIDAPREPQLAGVTTENVLGAHQSEPWLRRYADALLAANDAMTTLVAIGAMVRFFAPTEEQRDDELERVLAGDEPSVVLRARSALGAASPTDLDMLEGSCVERAVELLEQLDGMSQATSDGDATTATRLVEERDELESCRVALRCAEKGEEISDVLVDVDRAAQTHLPHLGRQLAGLVHERLRAAALKEPWAWWGKLVP